MSAAHLVMSAPSPLTALAVLLIHPSLTWLFRSLLVSTSVLLQPGLTPRRVKLVLHNALLVMVPLPPVLIVLKAIIYLAQAVCPAVSSAMLVKVLLITVFSLVPMEPMSQQRVAVSLANLPVNTALAKQNALPAFQTTICKLLQPALNAINNLKRCNARAVKMGPTSMELSVLNARKLVTTAEALPPLIVMSAIPTFTRQVLDLANPVQCLVRPVRIKLIHAHNAWKVSI